MTEHMVVIIGTTLYKITSLVVGLTISYLGYRLFMAGIWGSGGDLKSTYRNTSLVLKSAAPGTFFSLFGTIVIAFTISKGLEFHKETDAVEVKILQETKPQLKKTLPSG